MSKSARMLFFCPTCNMGLEVVLKRCPVCRRKHKADRKAADHAARKMRAKLSRHAKHKVFARDGYRCLACGSETLEKLTIDHIVPLSKGGTNHWDNLQTLCGGCNSRVKRGKTIDYRNDRPPS